MIESSHPKISVRRQCQLVSLARATYFEALSRGKALRVDPRADLRERIDRIYTEHPYFGSRRISRELWDRHNLVVNRKKVHRLMLKFPMNVFWR